MVRRTALVLALALVVVGLISPCHGALVEGYYKGKCGSCDVEKKVREIVVEKLLTNATIPARLVRLQFHDCFVNGCDASLLLDGDNTEKTAPPNLSVGGYDVIDAAKSALEGLCEGVVSCADIIIMATRDAVSLSPGGKWYPVQTGRKDGLVSRASDVNLPPPNISVSDSIAAFRQKGFSVTDMVYLLGGHTIGVAHCPTFQDRLYNYRNTGKPDPTIDPLLLTTLKQLCPQNSNNTDKFVNLDQDPVLLSALIVDNSYYKQIQYGRGVLQIDQDLASDSQTSGKVSMIADSYDFPTKFGKAMVKLGALQSGLAGEIRKSCRAVNPR